jgi:hypothetical protein
LRNEADTSILDLDVDPFPVHFDAQERNPIGVRPAVAEAIRDELADQEKNILETVSRKLWFERSEGAARASGRVGSQFQPLTYSRRHRRLAFERASSLAPVIRSYPMSTIHHRSEVNKNSHEKGSFVSGDAALTLR